MTQIRGTAGYHLSGNQNHFGGSSRPDATADTSPLDAIRQQTSKLEDLLDTMAEPLKPYLPVIGRFLIVVTFIEDALRIVTQWSDQLTYLHDYRHSESPPPHNPQHTKDRKLYETKLTKPPPQKSRAV